MKKQYYNPTTKIIFRLFSLGTGAILFGLAITLLLLIDPLNKTPYINIITVISNISWWLFFGSFAIGTVIYLYKFITDKYSRTELLEFGMLGQIYQPGDEREEIVKYKAGYHAYLAMMGLAPLVIVYTCLLIVWLLVSKIADPEPKVIMIMGTSILFVLGFGFVIFRLMLRKQGIEWSKRNKKKS